ncbi:MAG TPA: hypothetical protein VGL61_07195 [Kofleriaceae bacterium]|jgi:hypothetical protein
MRPAFAPLAIGILGIVGVVLGFALDTTEAAYAYLTAWAFAMSIALGALVFLMTGYAMGAKWTALYERSAAAIVGTLPVLAILFVPIVIWAPSLYPWLHAPPADLEIAARAAHRAAWLNLPFWTIRAAIFLAFWVIAGELMRRRPSPATACVLFMPLGLTVTFAAFDWLMSLEPDWISTVYGLIYFAGGFVAALALIAVVSRGTAAATGALSRLIHGFLIFWLYVEFAQGFIIWIANKPDEVPWYVLRGNGGWGEILAILALGAFVVPFFAFLPRNISRDPRWAAAVGVWIVCLHYLNMAWLVMPALHAAPELHWVDVAAPAAVLGLAAAVAIWRRPPPLADDDPRLARATAYRGNDS